MSSVRTALQSRILDSIDAVQPPERYKIVVLDGKTERIVQSACKEMDIMDRNVTLLENMEKPRQAYPSLEAVYLLTPCIESVNRLIDDFPAQGQPKYKAAHVLFSGSLGDHLFSRLRQSGISNYIQTLKELYIDFVAVESRVFSFDSPQSIYTLFSPARKHELDLGISMIAKQLLSVIATFGDFPLIRYFQPPEVEDGKRTQSLKIATSLQSELESYIHANPDMAGRQQGQGTVLILDRSIDVTAALVHEFTYQAMTNDLLPIEDGCKYTYEIENEKGDKESVTATIDENDRVFMDIRHMHIVETTSTLTSKLNKFIAEHEAMRGDKDKVATLNNIKDQLASLPEYQDLKSKYSTHIHMAKECMRIFEKYKINELGLIEQQLATGETVDGHLPKQILSEMLPLLDDPAVSSMDKIRMLMLYTICRGGLRPQDRQLLYQFAKISDGNAEAIWNLNYFGVNVERHPTGTRTRKKGFLPRKKTPEEEQMYELSRYVTKVKKVVEEHILGTLDTNLYPYTTEHVPNTDSYDPSSAARSLRKTTNTTWDNAKKKNNVKGARLYVFVAGGLTYSELRAMYEICEQHNRDVIVGSTHIMTPRQFVLDLRQLGRGVGRPTKPLITPYTPAPAPTPSPPVSSSSGKGGSMNGSQKPSSGRPNLPTSSGSSGSLKNGAPATTSGGQILPNGMRTIQKDASGRFVAPSPTPPPSSGQMHYGGQPNYGGPGYQQQQQHTPPPTLEKKKGKIFGFI
ncbi:vacuolar sorting protein VPS33/slp1 [Actinomortierella wolfii]|nr:vacuolar sorting protein VPS33/slp1 [Actinomortierella wolfii]